MRASQPFPELWSSANIIMSAGYMFVSYATPSSVTAILDITGLFLFGVAKELRLLPWRNFDT